MRRLDVKLTNGTLSSDRLNITGSGELIRFEGHVVDHLDNMNTAPSDTSAAPAAVEDTSAALCACARFDVGIRPARAQIRNDLHGP